MQILSLDTTTPAGSAALVIDGRVIDERCSDKTRSPAERLPRELIELAGAHGTSLAAIDLFAVASGPGSFTGLRVGIATIQGAARVHDRKVVAVSALDALAHAAAVEAGPSATVGAWMNAHRGEVFTALYEVTSAPALEPERLREIESATVGAPPEVIRRWADAGRQPTVIMGDGAAMYAEMIHCGFSQTAVRPGPVLAGVIGRLAYVRASRGEAIGPAAIQPVYVRRPDAELDREKKRAGEGQPAGGGRRP